MPIPSTAEMSLQPGAPAIRLTREHFALYRGYLDGLSDSQLHATYGDGTTDVRVTRRLIVTLRDTLAVTARRGRDNEAAHLLRLKPGSIPLVETDGVSASPSLEAYRESVDPGGVYSESELLDLYQADYPVSNSPSTDRRIARNARLRRRQADALARMEATLVQAPKPEHRLEGWFEPAITRRLDAAGIRTLADLMEFIERHGNRWHARIARIGPKAAQRIADWLTLHAASLQRRLSTRANTPRRQLLAGDPALRRPRQTGVFPLESLLVPAALDGSRGTNRASQRPLRPEMDSDLRAIEAWLATFQASAHTARAYRREAERVLLWAIVEKGKALSSLNPPDCENYVEMFLKDPQPATRWVGRGRSERFKVDWRPFSGALSERSRETARSILRAMGQWLVDQRYLASNPFGGVSPIRCANAGAARALALTHDQWRFIVDTTARERYTARELRDRLALLLARETGLRRAELAAATVGRFRRKAPGGDARDHAWEFEVPDKGGRTRLVVLSDTLVDLLALSLRARKLPDLASCEPDTRVLVHTRTGDPLTPDGIGQIFKRIFSLAAGARGATSEELGCVLLHATTQWLRQTRSGHAQAAL
jgi:site-specific recombinase XerD